MKFLIIAIFILLIGFFLRKSYQSRTYIEDTKHTEITLKGIKVNWFYLFITGINGSIILLSKGFKSLDQGEYAFVSLLFLFLLFELGNILLQIKVKRDRFILKNGEILFVAEQKTSLATDTIQELVLTHFTKQLKIKTTRRNKLISVSIKRLSKEDLTRLLRYLKKEVGSKKMTLSEDLSNLIK